MLPQIIVQCENNGDPMTLKIVQCELGIWGVLTFVASGLDINGCVKLFWGDSKFTLLYKLYTHYFTL